MTLITVYMIPGENPSTIGAFMYTDTTMSTRFYPNGFNNSYRPMFLCVTSSPFFSVISSNCYRVDPELGIQFVCGGLPNEIDNGTYSGDVCIP
jgi:hypothetical protein